MDWLITVVADLTIDQEAIREDNQQIIESLEEVRQKLQIISASLDEQILRGLRTGIRHLIDGLNSDLTEVRDDELREARNEFAKLTSLDTQGKTSGTSGEVDNRLLIGLGYWGNVHYFNLRGDMRNALLQVYECTRQYPDLGLVMFSPEFFSKNYFTEIGTAISRLEELARQRDQREWDNLWKGIGNFGKHLFRGVYALGAGLVGAAIFLPLGPLAIRTILQEKIDVPLYEDTEALNADIEQTTRALEQLSTDLKTECETRSAVLRKVTLNDLLKIKPGTKP